MPDQQPHTPTTEEVRLAHAESVTFHQMEEPELTEANSMFDRWLAARDAHIEAAAEQRGAIKALRDTADHIENEIEFVLPNRHKPLRFRRSYEQDGSGLTPEEWLRARSDRLEGDDE